MNLEEINAKIKEKEEEVKVWKQILKREKGKIRSKGKRRIYTCVVCGNKKPCTITVLDDDMFMPHYCFYPHKKAIWLRKEE